MNISPDKNIDKSDRGEQAHIFIVYIPNAVN